MHTAILVLLLGILLQAGCSGSAAPLNMNAFNPDQDHRKIAAYYRHEAVVSRQKADEATHRAVVYEQLFGRESDWVKGTLLLAQYYGEAAREEERLARRHLELVGEGRASSPPMQSRDH